MMKPMRVRQEVWKVRTAAWLFLAFLSAGGVSSGQTLPPQLPPGPLTLEQVLDLAETRSETLAIVRTGITRADAERIRARSGLFPQLSASASYERALASEFEGVFDAPGGPACAPFTLNPDAAIEARVAEIERAIDCGAVGSGFFGGGQADADGGLEDLPFGRENTWRVSLAFSQNLYSGGRLGAQAAVARAGQEAAGLSLTTARGQLLFEATQAYYDAALSARLVAIAEATVEQADATLRQVQAGFDAGTQPEFEVLRARVSRDNQRPLLIRQQVNREIAMLRLKQLLDLPANYDLRIADALEDDLLAPAPVFAPRIAAVETAMARAGDSMAIIAQGLAAELPRRAAVDAAEVEVRRSEAAFDLTEAAKRPSVTLTSNYGRVAYPSGLFEGFDNWRTNWTLGASVELPILTGGRQRGDELAARAQVEESRVRLQQVQELAGLDTRLAWAELLAARAAWEASAGTVEQAGRAYEIADVRYRAGVSTQLELSDSRLLLQQAEANRAQAARDVQVARARVALLPELPLGATTGGAQAPAQQQPVQPQTPAAPPQQAGTGGFQTTAAQGGQTQVGR
jgi:outer membrane protein TolC